MNSAKNTLNIVVIAMMAVVLMTQSTVTAQTAGMANKSAEAELKQLVTKMKTEVERRIAENTKAIKALESSNTVSGATKKSVNDALQVTKKSLAALKKEIANVKDLKTAKDLAVKIDAEYDQYAGSNATAQSLKSGDTQQQSFMQLQTTAGDARAMIVSAGTSGKDVTALKEHIENLDKLVESIGAIVASIIALIAALAGGNFSGAMVIFQTIIGQLAQNLESITTAQTELAGIVETLNNFQGLTAGAPQSVQ